MSNILFNPTEKIVMECEYFQVRNDIFDLEFTVRATKRFKEGGNLVKNKVLVEYRELNIYEKLTYIYLCRCANNKDSAFPSYNDIAKKIGSGRNKAIDSIKVLNENGFIYKENRFKTNGESTSNIYYINTKLSELKLKLDGMYNNKEVEIIESENSGLADKLGGLSDKRPSGLADKLGGLSDKHKQKQYNKNNIKQKQYNNNTSKVATKTTAKKKTKTVVVDEEVIKLKAKLFVLLNINFEDKEVESIIKALKDKYNYIDDEVIKNVCSLIKNSKTEIKNVIAFILSAIKNDYKEVNSNKNQNNNTELKFNNFESREYDYDSLEKQLLGWEQ